MNKPNTISKIQLYLGSIIFIVGFISPIFIPFITNSNLSIEWKTVISGLLAFGIPEIFIVIAISIMGKSGYEFLKSKFITIIKPLAPKDEVSLTRYRVGLAMFSLPLILGWTTPYLSHFFPFIKNTPYWYYIVGDVFFLSSFFVLGGDFWDKLSVLFKHNIKVST